MAEIKIKQHHVDRAGTLRLVLDGERRLDYFNIRDGATDGVITPKVQ